MPIKQSVCYPMFEPLGLGLDELFGIAAGIGYAAVEIWERGDDFEAVVALAHKHGLAVASMVGHASLADGLNKRANHARIEAELRASIDVAAQHGVPGLICFSGNRQPHQSEPEAIEAVADGLRRVAPYAEEKGVNMNPSGPIARSSYFNRVVRGGSFGDAARNIRVSQRSSVLGNDPSAGTATDEYKGTYSPNIGFRCASDY